MPSPSRGVPSQGGASRGSPSRGGTTRGGFTRRGSSQGGASRGSPSRGGATRGGFTRGGSSQGGAPRGGSRGGSSRTSRGGPSGFGGGDRGSSAVKKREPNRIVQVPMEFRRQTSVSERTQIIESWKNETGCEIVPQPFARTQAVIVRFELYGSAENVDKAVRKIGEWIVRSAAKSSETTSWAKTPAHNMKTWYKDYSQKETNIRKQKFLKDIDEEEFSDYKSVVFVEWPVELSEAQVTMKDALGTDLSKLNPIRMDNEVFIKAVGLSKLEIRGPDLDRTKSAGDCVKSEFTRVYLLMNHKFVYPLYMMMDKREGLRVIYEKSEAWWPDTTHQVAPRLLPCAMTGSGPGEHWQDLNSDQYLGVQNEMLRALAVARYKEGAYDLSIRLGCLALKHGSIGAEYEQDRFMSDITEKKDLDCVIKHWLFDEEDGQKLLNRLFAADNILETASVAFDKGTAALSQTKPTLRGTWVFQDPDTLSPSAAPYLVQIHWAKDELGLYDKISTRCCRLTPGSTTPVENMDIKLLQMKDSKGWQISLTSMAPVSTRMVPAILGNFIKRVQIKPNYKVDVASKERFVEIVSSPSLKVLTERLDQVYTMGIKNTSYRLDAVSMLYRAKGRPCWGLLVYHDDWKYNLAKVLKLPTGHTAQWGDTLSTFLPDDGGFPPPTEGEVSRKQDSNGNPLPEDGIRLLLTKLTQLTHVVFPDLIDDTLSDYPAIPPEPRGPA